MRHERDVVRVQSAHRELEVVDGGVFKVADAAGRHERLQPDDARVDERLELRLVPRVVRHESAPERDVDVELVRAGFQFQVEGLRVHDGGVGVERHVHERGHAPRGGGLGARLETLPVHSPGLVEVDVNVHEAGEDDEIAVVDELEREGRERRARG